MVAGESQPRRRTLTGPARPRRSVCAPTAMAFSLYRRPPPTRSKIMRLLSWLPRPMVKQLRKRPSRKRRPKPHCRLQLEALEDRTVPSTLSVNTVQDVLGHAGGLLSLRQAILDANASNGANTI